LNVHRIGTYAAWRCLGCIKIELDRSTKFMSALIANPSVMDHRVAYEFRSFGGELIVPALLALRGSKIPRESYYVDDFLTLL
jgi:hypothetical protein